MSTTRLGLTKGVTEGRVVGAVSDSSVERWSIVLEDDKVEDLVVEVVVVGRCVVAEAVGDGSQARTADVLSRTYGRKDNLERREVVVVRFIVG